MWNKFSLKTNGHLLKIGALTLLRKGSGPSVRWIIAAWHNEKSITWRWFIEWTPKPWPNEDKLKFYRNPKKTHGATWVTLPLLGKLTLHWQPSMYRK